MEEQKTKSLIPKLAAGAGGAGLVAITMLTGAGDGTTQPTAVSVTPTAIVAEEAETSEPERTVSVTQELTPTREVVFVATVTVTVATEPGAKTPTPEPNLTTTVTITPSPTVTPTVKPTDTPTPTVKLTDTPTSTGTPTVTPKPTATLTVKPTATPTEPPVPTVTPKAKPNATVTPMVKPTATPTIKPSATPKLTSTPTPASTPKPTNTPRPTNTPKPTPVVTHSPTPTPTPVPTATPSPIPEAWKEPKERTDLAEMLMAKVNAYRESQGLRRWEDPFVYYETDYPELGEYMTERGLRVAKKCCLEHSASHEHSQIGSGVYYYPWQVTDIWKDEMVEKLFNNWYGSPAHNRNMLYDGGGEEDWIGVAVMHVVEHFDGEDWHYCAIMTVSFVSKDNLPEGLTKHN